jgi:hypothetical protein
MSEKDRRLKQLAELKARSQQEKKKNALAAKTELEAMSGTTGSSSKSSMRVSNILHDTAEVMESRYDKWDSKKKEQIDHFEWSVFNPEVQYKAYERRVGSSTVPALKPKSDTSADPVRYGLNESKPSEEEIDRMVKDLDETYLR